MRIRNKLRVLLSMLVMALVFTGCSVRSVESRKEEARIKSIPSPSLGNAGVYIFNTFIKGYHVWINDKCFGETINNAFFYAEVQGNKEHKIGTKRGQLFDDYYLNIFMEEGKNYFIERNFTSGGGLLFAVSGILADALNITTPLVVVDEIEGKEAIQSLSLVVDKEGKASTKNSTFVVNGICK